jgi:predicted nucleic-acid-binding protein
MLAIDTHVLVRLVANDDAVQVRFARERTARGAWVSHVVLAESIWVLTSIYALSREEVVAAIETLLTHADVQFEDSSIVRTALQHFKQRKSVAFSDCLILEIARKAGHIPLATFDRDGAKLEGVERLDKRA